MARSHTTTTVATVLYWPAVRPLVDRVHLNVCGHSSVSDKKTLLGRTSNWTSDVAKYLSEVFQRCGSCRVTTRLKPSQKVILSSLHRRFNNVSCVNHFFLDGVLVFHKMDAETLYSAGLVCTDLTLTSALHAFETVWLSPFWAPRAVQDDESCIHGKLTSSLSVHVITFCPVPPHRHSKNVLESKHGFIRSICLRLIYHNPTLPILISVW